MLLLVDALQRFAHEAWHTVNWKELVCTAVPFAVFLQCFFWAMSWYFVHVRKDKLPLSEKRKAYFCSLAVSCLGTPFGIYYAARILQPGWRAEELLESDALSRVLLILFWTYLLVDMGIGFFEYRNEFGVLSGWIHHVFYAGFLSHAYVKGYTIAFAYTLVMESSSILLSGGRLFPFLRRDWLFGLLFLAFRIVYHAFLLFKLATMPEPRVVMWYPVAGVWFLHCYWFHGWVQGMKRKYRTRAKGEIATPYSLSSPPYVNGAGDNNIQQRKEKDL